MTFRVPLNPCPGMYVHTDSKYCPASTRTGRFLVQLLDISMSRACSSSVCTNNDWVLRTFFSFFFLIFGRRCYFCKIVRWSLLFVHLGTLCSLSHRISITWEGLFTQVGFRSLADYGLVTRIGYRCVGLFVLPVHIRLTRSLAAPISYNILT